MATNQLNRVIQTLRTAALPDEGDSWSDGQLLEAYVASREEAAFAALVRRHGPMVWGVCRRVLPSYQDAEDAFQATFLVLVRKASSIVPRDRVANWLYGVAHQTARKARAMAAKRHGREKQVTAMPEPALEQQDRWDDLRVVLDQELSRLPEKYRAVLVLCDLEGKTRKEASGHLRLPEGTVATRLATARTMLARRLARTGLTMSGGALATLLAQQLAAAGMPASVASSTIKAATLFAAGQAAAVSVNAVALAEGVLKIMLLQKLKWTTAVFLMVVVLTTSAAAFTHGLPAGQSPGQARKAADQTKENPARADQAAGQPVAQQNEPPERASPKKEAELIPDQVSGIVKAVDVPQSTLTVAHQGGASTFRVAKDADINIDGKRGELKLLPVGASIQLRQFVDARTTRSVLAEGRWFWGVIKSVDLANSTITYGDNAQEGAAGRTFRVPKDLHIAIDGKGGRLAAIPAGANANLQLLADQKTVRSLSVEGKQVNGTVKAVDAARRTITVDTTTYPVAQDAHIGIDHKPGKLEDLPPGANVGLNLQVDQKTVLRVSATGSSDFGQVKAVDAANHTITVTGGPPNDRVYNVPPDAPIQIDGKAGKLADIPVGAGLHALNLCVDQKTVSSINVVGPSYHRVELKAVDGEKGVITIADNGPNEIAGKTLAVAPPAGITIDGAAGKLAGVPAGAFVNLGLTTDSQTVLHLQAEGPTLGGCGGCEASAIDAINHTVTFAVNGPAEVAGKTFRVAQNVGLQMDGRPGKLANLPVGSYLNITLAVDRQTVRSIWATGPPVPGFGVVKAVDAEKRTVTVGDRTYPVAANANIVMASRGGLVALPVGATVALRLCVDQKTVGTIAVQGK